MTMRGNFLRRFARDKRGVSAVEFALIAPLMIGLYLSCVEMSDAIGVNRKVTQTTAALANVASQATTITNSDMTDILNAASDVMTPYPTTTLKITVSSLKIDASGNAKVVWSDTKNGTARAVNSAVTVPSAVAVPNTYLIFSEVSYGYTPAVGHTITGTLTLSDKMFMSPRLSSSIARTS